ncbi:MAG: dockerin type I domain-containing protein [Bacillota bacterium]|nr:dockerin type I domain-containing protein [Bacillota bacterium]
MRSSKKVLKALFITIILTTVFLLYATCNAATPTPASGDDTQNPLLDTYTSNHAYTSINGTQTIVLNSSIAEWIKGCNYTVSYEYWTEDDPTKVIKTIIYKTYNANNFSAIDSYELYNLKAFSKYNFRAILTLTNNNQTDTYYSKINSFNTQSAPTAPYQPHLIYGYVAPEFKTENKIERGGFKVSLNGGAAETVTDSSGYFSFMTSACSTVFYNIKISKPGYIERNIDAGYVWKSSEAQVNVSQNGAYTIMMCGDINSDGLVNMADVIAIAKSFNLIKGNEGYMENADFNCDGVVNFNDIVLTAKNFSKSANDYSTSTQVPYFELKCPETIVYTPLHGRNPLKLNLYGYNLSNISGYKVNFRYNYASVKVDESSILTVNTDDTLLINNAFEPQNNSKIDSVSGKITWDKYYLMLGDYRKSGLGEASGKLGSIDITFIGIDAFPDFLTVSATPDSTTGASYTDWDNKTQSDIEVLLPHFNMFQAIP